MIFPTRKTIGYRRDRSKMARRALARYERNLHAGRSPDALEDLYVVSTALMSMVSAETGQGSHEARKAVDNLHQASMDLRQVLTNLKITMGGQ